MERDAVDSNAFKVHFDLRIACSLLLISSLLLPSQLFSDHLAGAEIRYTYIGDSTGVARQYLVELLIYRDVAGIPLANTQYAKARSSCFTEFTISLNRSIPPNQLPFGDQGYQTSAFYECVDPSVVGTSISTHYYSNVIVLPGLCHDIQFYWLKNARNASDNLVNAASSNLFVFATLNNTQGPNSSPRFLSPAAKVFCTQSSFVWSHAAIENDGDSIYYRLANALSGPNGVLSLIPYSAGFSAQQPLTTAAGSGGVSLDSSNGTLYFTTSNVQEICVVVVEALEFRRDSATGNWFRVGSSLRDMQVVVASNCRSSVTNGPIMDDQQEGYARDTISGALLHYLNSGPIPNDTISNPLSPTGYDYIVSSIPYACYDSIIDLKFNVGVLCESIATDASDFVLYGPDSNAIPIVSINFNCGVDLMTSKIQLRLNDQLRINGDYILQVSLGTDSNTLMNSCGFELAENHTIVIDVRECYYPIFELSNVSIDSNDSVRVSYDFDSTSFPIEALDGIEFFRSDDLGLSYQSIDVISPEDAAQRKDWKDPFANRGDVERQSFHYRIEGIVNQRASLPSNSISSIHLDTISNTLKRRVSLVWNSYEAWSDVEYRLMISQQPETPSQWIPLIAQGINPTRDTSFLFELPMSSGCYFLRVDAINPSNAEYLSQSNWFNICTENYATASPSQESESETRALFVPNVFSPNGDGHNDYFKLGGLENWDRVEMQIFNRWGEEVYSTKNAISEAWDGTNKASGSLLADGVYFYIIRSFERKSGISKRQQGSVSIQTGGL